MKKLLGTIAILFLFLSNVNANERENKLNSLFKQLKNSEASSAVKIENKIWKIWSTHPSNNEKGLNFYEKEKCDVLSINSCIDKIIKKHGKI